MLVYRKVGRPKVGFFRSGFFALQIHERAELGPIQARQVAAPICHKKWAVLGNLPQVAFAKGEATRMGLDAAKEQLPARWQALVFVFFKFVV